MPAYRSNTLFQVILELNKVRITAAVALTTVAGYVLFKRTFDLMLLAPVAGIFILACGASVINHLQEMKTDAKMERTRRRPLPAGKIDPFWAGILAVFEIAAGLFILYFFSGFLAFLLGFTALLWYNAIYVNLKKITVHAVIPGSVIGAIPPLTGWVAAGGSLLDHKAWIIGLFFFVWQVPHFYLLAYKYAYDYQSAGFPSLLSKYSTRQIWKFIFLWIVATAVIAILLPLTGVTFSVITAFGIVVFSLWVVVVFTRPLKKANDQIPGKYFMKINYFVLAVVLLQIFDIFFSRAA
jgi:heme o synthase